MGFNQFQIVANNVVLDTYEDFNVSLNYQISDITDISTRSTRYSKTLVIPGTPKNNEFFKNLFELNIDISTSSYNPKVALPCSIIVSDEEVFFGNLQLIEVRYNQKFVEYEVIITGILKNLLFGMSDFYLSELDLSEYNHFRDIQTIENSWDYIITKNGSLYDASGLGEGYVYPYINNGNSSSGGSVTYVYDMYPAVYVKTIIDKMFEFAGYSYTSTFFNTDYFKSLIIPFTQDKLEYDDSQLSGLTTTIGVDASLNEAEPSFSGDTLQAWENANPGGVTNFRQLSPVFRVGENYNSQGRGFFFPLDLETGSVLGKDMTDPGNRFTNSIYTCDTDGFYDVTFEMTFFMKYINKVGAPVNISHDMNYCAAIMKKSPGQPWTPLQFGPYPDYCSSRFTPTPGNHPPIFYDLATEISISMDIPNVYIQAGEQIAVRFFIRAEDFVNPADNELYIAVVTNNQFSNSSANYLEIKPSTNSVTSPNIDIDMNQILPRMKMKEFFLSIVKMFNLIVSDNPNKTGDILIEPKDLFYNSRKKIKDWSPILDENFDIEIVPMSELDVNLYSFQYEPDDDYINKKYTEETGLVYSNYEFEFLNDFSNETKEIKVGFSPTPDTNLFVWDKVSPFFAEVSGTNDVKPKKVKPRILFYTGLKQGQFILKNTPSSTGQTNYNTYPYCGMWDDPYDPQFDLGWGQTKKIYWDSQVSPNNTLVNQFYQTTLTELQDVNAKLVTAYFYLTPKDIKDFDFRDIILLNNGYYRVNKIIDYNPNGIDKTTKVELYKLDNVDYYQLTQVGLPGSLSECPTDIVTYDTPIGDVYISSSGQIISESCCKQLNGVWIEGVCKRVRLGISTGNGDPVSVDYGSGIGTQAVKIPTDGFNNTTTSELRPVDQNKNNNSINSPDSIILGSNVYVPPRSVNVSVIGDNVVVNPNIKNSLVIGDNNIGQYSESIVVGDILINTDGIQYANPYKIDAGENEVMRVSKTNLIDKLDGGQNSVRNFGGDSKLRPIIDGSEKPLFE